MKQKRDRFLWVGLVVASGLSLLLYRPKPAMPLRHVSDWQLPDWAKGPALICTLTTALAIVNEPKTPIDDSTPLQAVTLPTQVMGDRAVPVSLPPREELYFTAYGGTAKKVQYGPLGLNLVRTSSPVRHLHAPDICLRGLGFDVCFKGTVFDPIPNSIFEATGLDGHVWHVAVSYVSEDGHDTAGAGEAVWDWLSGASRNWQSIQSITPATLPGPLRQSYEAATLAALDLS